MTDTEHPCDVYQQFSTEWLTGSETDRAMPEFQQFVAHVRNCASCRRMAGEWLHSLCLLPLALESSPVSEEFKQRVLARVQLNEREILDDSGPQTRVSDSHLVATRKSGKRLVSWQRSLSYGLAAAILLGIVGWQFFYLHRLHVMSLAIQEPATQSRLQAIEEAVAELRKIEAQARAAKIRMVALRDAQEDALVRAHAIWDEVAWQLHLFIFDVPPLKSGEVYAIWFVTDAASPLFVATFVPDRKGQVGETFNGPTSLQDLWSVSPQAASTLEIRITIEGSTQPASPSDRTWLHARLK